MKLSEASFQYVVRLVKSHSQCPIEQIKIFLKGIEIFLEQWPEPLRGSEDADELTLEFLSKRNNLSDYNDFKRFLTDNQAHYENMQSLVLTDRKAYSEELCQLQRRRCQNKFADLIQLMIKSVLNEIFKTNLQQTITNQSYEVIQYQLAKHMSDISETKETKETKEIKETVEVKEVKDDLLVMQVFGDKIRSWLKPYSPSLPSFTSQSVAPITIENYLLIFNRRIVNGLTFQHLILLIIYLDRFQANGLRKLNENNIHRLLVTALVTVLKFHDEELYRSTNKCFARIGGLQEGELNILEKEFLDYLDFNLYISVEEYSRYENEILKAKALAESYLEQTSPVSPHEERIVMPPITPSGLFHDDSPSRLSVASQDSSMSMSTTTSSPTLPSP